MKVIKLIVECASAYCCKSEGKCCCMCNKKCKNRCKQKWLRCAEAKSRVEVYNKPM
jgi:hypothetical protein